MSFTTTRLVGSRALVKGTDSLGTEGSVVVDTTQWDEVNANTAYKQAQADFDAAVEEFFKPLTEAAEAASVKVERPDDPAAYVVLEEKVEGTPAKAGHLIKLTHDSVVLRLVEQGDTDRLIWVNGALEVQEVLPGTAAVQP